MGRFGSKKQVRQTSSGKAGLLFPVSRVKRYLRTCAETAHFRQSIGAAVYTTAVLEYLAAEWLELAGSVAKTFKVKYIKPRHLMLAMKQDEEILKLCQHVILPNCGVVGHIHNVLNDRSPTAKVPPPVVKPTAVKKTAKAASTVTKKAGKAKGTSSGTAKNTTEIQMLGEKTVFLGFVGRKLTVVQNDISKVVADAVVHPTGSSYGFSGEVGSALSRAGGASLREDVKKLQDEKPRLGPAEAAIGGAGSALPFSHVIHVNSPSWNASNSANCVSQLETAVQNVLKLANENKLKTIAIPSISSGNAGFPKQVAAETILRTVQSFFASNEHSASGSLRQVLFVLFDHESVEVYKTELGRLV